MTISLSRLRQNAAIMERIEWLPRDHDLNKPHGTFYLLLEDGLSFFLLEDGNLLELEF